MMAARSLLWLIGTLAVVGTLWLTLLSGGGGSSAGMPTTAPSGATSGYNSTIGAAHSAVQQSNEDAQRGSAAGAP